MTATDHGMIPTSSVSSKRMKKGEALTVQLKFSALNVSKHSVGLMDTVHKYDLMKSTVPAILKHL